MRTVRGGPNDESEVYGVSDTTRHPDERSLRERPEAGHVGDLATPYVLRALEPTERAWVERHRRLCPECDRLLTGEERFVSLLPFAVRATHPPPPDVKVALFARVAHSQRTREAVRPSGRSAAALTIPALRPVPLPAAPSPIPHGAVPRPSSPSGWRTRWMTALLVVPLLVVLAGAGAWAAQLRAEADERGDRADGFGQMLERALNGDGTVYPLLPGPAAPEAKGWVVTEAGRRSATLFLRNPTARPGQRYRILATREGSPEPLDVVTLDERGRGVVTFELDLASAQYRQFRLKLLADDEAESGATGLALFGRIDGPVRTSGGGTADAPAGESPDPIVPQGVAPPAEGTESAGRSVDVERGG